MNTTPDPAKASLTTDGDPTSRFHGSNQTKPAIAFFNESNAFVPSSKQSAQPLVVKCVLLPGENREGFGENVSDRGFPGKTMAR